MEKRDVGKFVKEAAERQSITCQQRAIEVNRSQCSLPGEWVVSASEAFKLANVGSVPVHVDAIWV